MANIIFTGQGFQHIVENIFLQQDFDDLLAFRKKGGCELINKWCHGILKDPHFWLKKWTQQGLTKSDKAEWIRIFDLAENTKQEQDVLKFIKRVIQRGHLVSVRCFITENDLEKFLNLRKIPDEVILAMGNEELGIVQLLAPVLVKSPNTLNQDGYTPIARAVNGGFNKVDKVKVLAPLMVNPNAPDDNGETPIHQAAFHGDVEIVEYLAPLTDNPNPPNNYGKTPMHIAARNGFVDIIRILTALVENPNPQDKDGWTPMQTALLNRRVDVVKFLADFVIDEPYVKHNFNRVLELLQ